MEDKIARKLLKLKTSLKSPTRKLTKNSHAVACVQPLSISSSAAKLLHVFKRAVSSTRIATYYWTTNCTGFSLDLAITNDNDNDEQNFNVRTKHKQLRVTKFRELIIIILIIYLLYIRISPDLI